MFLQRYHFRWSMIAFAAAVVGCVLLYESLGGIRIETDILTSLPRHDPVLADAQRVIRHLPAQDRLVIDVAIKGGDRDALVARADLIEEGLRASGLFRQVGTQQAEKLFPELVSHVVDNLHLLFDGEELEARIAPLLTPSEVHRALAENLKLLQGLEGTGQAGIIARDPLALRNLVLSRMAQLMPGKDAQFYRGKIFSPDGNHILVTAELVGSATDTAYTKAIPVVLEKLASQLEGQYEPRGIDFTLTPGGAYRAALDNENAARRDMRTAILLTTAGIALLLVITFPRPLVGLLAIIPSTVGAIFALLVCSFIFPSLSILAVSFGGAIMAFTVDLGITYLLFLDRPCEVSGKQAAREVRSGELLAALTTIGGFLLLLLSKFSVLAEIGIFAALGVAFTFAFVHLFFPLILPVMPPALKPTSAWLGRALERMSLSWGNRKLVGAALFFMVMLFLARPVFLVDINAMNSLSAETIAAEKTLQRIWGDLTSRVYVMTEGRSFRELQDKSDRLAGMFREDVNRGVIGAAFSLPDLFPGEALARHRADDWRAFWTPVRVAELRRELERSGRKLGFAPEAFHGFIDSLLKSPSFDTTMPEKFASMLGITVNKSAIVQVTMVKPGAAYEADRFFARYSAANLASLFDAGLFNRRLGEVLVSLFTEIAVITGLGIVLVVFFFFLDWRLTLIVLAPVAFALVCTLGTLKLIGHPVDIPGIMLWIVIMGMGIDYGIYYTCSYQRYLDERHSSMGLIRQAMFLSGATTMIGFGILAIAQHAVLKSIGLTSLLGIAYSLAGAFVIVPPLVKRVLVPVELLPETFEAGSLRHTKRAILRYRHVETTPRIFAHWKLRLDPMFPRLALFMNGPRRILDIGCGYGVPSVWLLELFPAATVTGIDPDEERVRIASQVLGSRGDVRVGRAPDIEGLPGGADTALVLDIIHMLNDDELRKTISIVRDKLVPGGRLVIRATHPRDGSRPFMGRVEEFRLRRLGLSPHYRAADKLAAMISVCGFHIDVTEPAAAGSEEMWFVASRMAD